MTAATDRGLTRVLLTPLRVPAWRTYLYFVLISGPWVCGFVSYVFLSQLRLGLPILVLVGISLLALVVASRRLWNRLYRSLARLLDVTIDAPTPFVGPAGWPATLRAALTDAVLWRSTGFLALQAVLITPIGYLVFAGVTELVSWVISPMGWWMRSGHGIPAMFVPFVNSYDPSTATLASSLQHSAAGLLALYLLGWLILGIARAHVWLAQALLGPTDRERRVAQLERARADVVDDAAATLRRVERDLHDGTQARLITVAMALARADEHLAGSPNAIRARELVAEALANTKDTLAELRDLVRRIHPPALDLGLGPAVQTLAARNPIPVDLVVDIPLRPSQGVETLAYFCVAELLANASRHSGASQAIVRLHSDEQELRIVVQDNGSGGAQPGHGSGLTGLRGRLAMVDGSLRIDSPDGGPTVVTVVVPLGAQQ